MFKTCPSFWPYFGGCCLDRILAQLLLGSAQRIRFSKFMAWPRLNPRLIVSKQPSISFWLTSFRAKPHFGVLWSVKGSVATKSLQGSWHLEWFSQQSVQVSALPEGIPCLAVNRDSGALQRGDGSQRGHQRDKLEWTNVRKTREGWNCRFQKTPCTEGVDKVQAVSTQGSQQICLSLVPRIRSILRFG